MTELIPRVGHPVNSLHLNIINSIEGSADGTISGTATSTTWQTITNWASQSVWKLHSDTIFVASLHVTCWINGSVPTTAGFGLSINGVDNLVARGRFITASSHRQVTGLAVPIHDVPAGQYTVNARMCRLSGSGTVTIDSNDYGSWSLREVYPL